MRLPLRRLVALSGLLLLTGCSAGTTTSFNVTGPASAQVDVSVQFSGEAADALSAGSAAETQLQNTFQTRLGTAAKVHRSKAQVTYAADVDYAKLTSIAKITGVSSAKLSGTGSATTLTVGLDAPSALVDAITKAEAGQPQAASVVQTMLNSTQVVVAVHFAGGISAQTLTGAGTVHRTGSTAQVSRSVHDGAATFVVVGNPKGGSSAAPLIGGAGIAAVVIGVAVGARRRYRGSSPPSR